MVRGGVGKGRREVDHQRGRAVVGGEGRDGEGAGRGGPPKGVGWVVRGGVGWVVRGEEPGRGGPPKGMGRLVGEGSGRGGERWTTKGGGVGGKGRVGKGRGEVDHQRGWGGGKGRGEEGPGRGGPPKDAGLQHPKAKHAVRQNGLII